MHPHDRLPHPAILELLEAIFGDEPPPGRRPAPPVPEDEDEATRRARYGESLITELLTTLAGKGLITNADAQDVIRRAKERVAAKAEAKPARICCPLHDTRPHVRLDCGGCGGRRVPHLVEGVVARCRLCLTTTAAPPTPSA